MSQAGKSVWINCIVEDVTAEDATVEGVNVEGATV